MINNSTTLVNTLNKTILKTTAGLLFVCFFYKIMDNVSKASETLLKSYIISRWWNISNDLHPENHFDLFFLLFPLRHQPVHLPAILGNTLLCREKHIPSISPDQRAKIHLGRKEKGFYFPECKFQAVTQGAIAHWHSFFLQVTSSPSSSSSSLSPQSNVIASIEMW